VLRDVVLNSMEFSDKYYVKIKKGGEIVYYVAYEEDRVK
jgi:hypothetical protein